MRQRCGALAVLARSALGRLVRREVLDVDIDLVREPLDAGRRSALELGRHESQPADRRRRRSLSPPGPADVGRRRSASISPWASVKYMPIMRNVGRSAGAVAHRGRGQ
jgi:hypothetical protein